VKATTRLETVQRVRVVANVGLSFNPRTVTLVPTATMISQSVRNVTVILMGLGESSVTTLGGSVLVSRTFLERTVTCVPKASTTSQTVWVSTE
jgi:hypothetical protein